MFPIFCGLGINPDLWFQIVFMQPLITSPSNPKIKNLLALEKAKERKERGVFVIEGLKEVTLALAGGYGFDHVFFCPDLIDTETVQKLFPQEGKVIPVGMQVFAKIAYREGTGGIIGVAFQKEHSLSTLKLSPNPLVLVVEAVEKPGNLGALLRTADATALDAVIICDPRTDVYNANVVRSSVGCLFTTSLAVATSEEAIAWLKEKGIKVFCTYLGASSPYHLTDFKGPSAIVMGTESTGLSPVWTSNSDENIIIPMLGKTDSINVSTAAAVVLFEAKRQRGFR